MTPAAAGDPGAGSADLRYRVGMLSLTLSLISPLFALVVPSFGLHTATTAALIGFFLIGGPEIFLVVGVALAGKRALETIKTRLSAVFKRRFPPKAVSRRRR